LGEPDRTSPRARWSRSIAWSSTPSGCSPRLTIEAPEKGSPACQNANLY
jgi:hypothetical protein